MICDVISTGYQVERVLDALKSKKAELSHIGVIVNSIDESFKRTSKILKTYQDKIVAVHEYKLKKYEKADIKDKLAKKELSVIRINPFTNTPITKCLDSEHDVLMKNEDFLKYVDSKNIRVGFFTFNNLIHPYFFDMKEMLSKHDGIDLLVKMLDELKTRVDNTHFDFVLYPSDSGIEAVGEDVLKTRVFKDHDTEILKLERFQISEGWRFPHPSESLGKMLKEKKVLILDDGSCTGESILRMIDEAAALNVESILVLSIISRLTDHKREFFGKLNKLKTRDINEINIQVFFGTHWSIPTYHLAKSPVISELDWLNKVIEIQNIPFGIWKVGSWIKGQIEPRSIDKHDTNFLLKTKDGTDIKKGLVLTKHYIGQLSNYRYYSDYFQFVDELVSIYSAKNRAQRGQYPYRYIELVCAVVSHEPYLMDIIQKVVPDLVEILMEFVFAIFWHQTPIKPKDLYLDWDNKSLIQLVFIVHKSEIATTLTYEKFKTIITGYTKSKGDINYLLLKLIQVGQINLNQTSRDAMHITYLVSKAVDDTSILHYKANALKRTRSFLNSYASGKTFEEILFKVTENYDKIVDAKYHKEWMASQHTKLQTQLRVFEVKDSDDAYKIALNAWAKLKSFIEDLLVFSNNYPSFFKSVRNGESETLQERLEGRKDSLRKRHGRIGDIFLSLAEFKDNTQIAELRELAKKVYNEFMVSECTLYVLFSKVFDNDVLSIFNEIVDMEQPKPLNLEIDNDIPEFKCDLPELLLKEVFKELIANLRYADPYEKVIIKFSQSADTKVLELDISNKVGEIDSSTGSAQGLEALQNLNDFPSKNINYTKYEGTNIFIKF